MLTSWSLRARSKASPHDYEGNDRELVRCRRWIRLSPLGSPGRHGHAKLRTCHRARRARVSERVPGKRFHVSPPSAASRPGSGNAEATTLSRSEASCPTKNCDT